jgi:major membrane immunogen (membrane-anchored lipoprotein)
MAELFVRYIAHKGVSYLRAEDVADTLREMAATEETDVRKRLEALASELLKVNKPKENQ